MQIITALKDEEIEAISCGEIMYLSNSLLDIPGELLTQIKDNISSINEGVEKVGCIPVVCNLGSKTFSIETGESILSMLGFKLDNIIELDFPEERIVTIESTIFYNIVDNYHNEDIINTKVIRELKRALKVGRIPTTKMVYGFIPMLSQEMISKTKVKSKVQNLRYFDMRS